MISKPAFLIGAAAGYVLGARAGRERYEQIVSKAQELWGNPQVQAKVNDLEQTAGAAASQLPDKLGGAVSAAKGKVGGHKDEHQATEGAGDMSVTSGVQGSAGSNGTPSGGW